jgi:hypothetical protein
MSGWGLKIIKRPPSAAELIKQVNFGTAVGTTKTAKEGQAASRKSLRSNFTIRNQWPEVGPLSIKIKPATKTDLTAMIFTNADFLIPHEEGKPKLPRGTSLAVPTDQVRRNKRAIIPRGQRPKGLAGKVFVLKTKHGPVLAQRLKRGKRKGLVVLYGLERSVRIKKVSTFHDPIDKVVKTRLRPNIIAGIARALATAK